tara:strand:- start:58 stop:579 length:522 start_codon:yes stop_codon:yes gene_type:complete
MKDKLTIEQKKDILEGKGKVGGKYCNAIDENPYDSSDWNNRMPVSGWCFNTLDDGRVHAFWEEVFACYDGWDSSDSEGEYFDNMEIAVNSIWTRQAVDKVYSFIESIKHAEYITINEDSEFSDKYNPTMLIDVQRDSGNGTCGSYLIDTFDMNELLKNLRDNVYPLISGEYKA